MRCGRNVGNARADAQKFQVRNRAQPAQQIFQLVVAQQQRVAAAQQDVADFGMKRDVFDLAIEFRMEIVAAGVADEPRARAVAAIRGATVGDQEQHAVGIAMHQAGHGRMRILAARVAHFPWRGAGFLDARNHLPADRAMLIRRVNQVEKIRRDGQREPGVRELRAGEFLRRERGHQPPQLFRRRYPVFELPAPVVPVGVGNIMPETAPGGVEFLQKLELVACWRLLATRR